MTRTLLTVQEAQTELGGIGKSKLYELMKTGELRRIKLGARTFIDAASLDAFIVRLRHGVEQPYDVPLIEDATCTNMGALG
jgi:excisionase family DNA binding protein